MSVFRVERTHDYTVMSNHHLKNRALSLKAKGLLSLMLSLPDDWDYTLQGLAHISLEKVDAIRKAITELENEGYITRTRERDEQGRLRGTEYIIREQPISEKPTLENPILGKPTLDKPTQAKPTLENPTQLKNYKQSIKLSGAVLPQTEIRNLLRRVNRDTLIDAVEVLRHNENEVQNPQGYLYSVILNAVNAEHTSTLLELPDNMIDREMLYASD